MTTTLPYIGCKISLISKSEIRYEGILYTIDVNELTIALAKVKSFGTENRPTPKPVAPRSDVYEYIVFRGSDIKDIQVCEPPPPQDTLVGGLPNDPAIVQHSIPSAQAAFESAPSSVGLPRPPISSGAFGGHMGSVPGSSYGYQPMSGLPGGLVAGLAAQSVGSHSHQPASRPDTPLSRGKSPTADQGVQTAGLTPHKEDNRRDQNRRNQNQEPFNRAGQQQQNQRNQQSRGTPTNQYQNQYNRDNRQQGPMRGGGGVGMRGNRQGQGMQNDYRDGNRQQQGQNQQGQRNMGYQQQRPGNGMMMRGGRGRGGVMQRGGRGGGRPREVLKFDSEYDFEQANQEFKELEDKLAKTTLNDGADGNEAGDGNDEKIPREEPTGAEAHDDHHPEAGDQESGQVFYDKAKSFFDNISCEALERNKGVQKVDWRKERKLNVETFGVSNSYMRRGMFRMGNNRGGFRQGGNQGNQQGSYNRGGYYQNRNNQNQGRPFNRNNQDGYSNYNNQNDNRRERHQDSWNTSRQATAAAT